MNELFLNIESNLPMIFSLFIMLSLVTYLAYKGVNNPLILMFVAIVISTLTNIIGMIGNGMNILIIIVCSIILLLYFTIMKGGVRE